MNVFSKEKNILIYINIIFVLFVFIKYLLEEKKDGSINEAVR